MILANQKCVFDKRGLGYKTSKNEKYFKNYFVKVHQLYAIFVVEEDTLVVLVLLEIDPKRHQLLSQRRLGLKN